MSERLPSCVHGVVGECCHCDDRRKLLGVITEVQYVYDKDIRRLDKAISELVDKIAKIANHCYRENQQPFKCPVCNGKGKIQYTLPAGGYWEDKCNVCEGKGVLWK